jgi:hypoxanthine phosphoribosyltransferase
MVQCSFGADKKGVLRLFFHHHCRMNKNLMTPELIPVFAENEIKSKVADLGQRISTDYQGRELVVIGVLKGAVVFFSDLIRKLTIPVTIDFIGVSSYGAGTFSSGKIRLTKDISLDLKQKHVLIVEDIVDTGLTLSFLVDYLQSFGPESVRICAFIDKAERREVEIQVDYSCYKVREGFLVGYGLDFKEKYRELPEIYHLKI